MAKLISKTIENGNKVKTGKGCDPREPLKTTVESAKQHGGGAQSKPMSQGGRYRL